MSGKLGCLCVELSTLHCTCSIGYLENTEDLVTCTTRTFVVEITQSFNHLSHATLPPVQSAHVSNQPAIREL